MTQFTCKYIHILIILQKSAHMVGGKFRNWCKTITAGNLSFHISPASLVSTWAAVIKITLYATQREASFRQGVDCSHTSLLQEAEPPCCV